MSFLKDLSLDKIRNAAEDVYNQAKPKTDLEAKIYEVLSHKNWGASTTLLNDIARESFDYDKFPIITRLMWEAMDSRPAAWRVVFKGLTLCEHLVKHGSERCVDDARYHSHQLRSLEKFNFYEGTVDRGIGVREKAKQIVELLGDDDRIRDERNKAKALREKFGGSGDMGGISGGGGSGGVTDRYSGFGNSGGGGGYGGDKGFSSSYGGSGSAGTSDPGFSGRYHDKNAMGSDAKSNEPSNYGAEPTFASIPDATKPKKKTKKKKKKAAAAAAIDETAAAPEVDLFSFDSPEPAAAPATAAPAPNDDEFDAFTSARTAPATSAFDNAPAPVTAKDDLFGDFSGSQAQTAAPTQAPVIDPFAPTAPTTSNTQQASFNNPPMISPQINVMQGGVSNGMAAPLPNAAAPTNIMPGTNKAATASQPSDEPDDFGDFSGPATSTQTESADPISKLINLDSLSLNKKKEDKTEEPIIYNTAAHQSYVTHKTIPKGDISSEFAFSGIDGIQKPTNLNINSSAGHRNAGQPIMSTMSSQPSGMGGNMQGGMMGGNMQGTGMMGGGMQASGMMGGNMQGAGMMSTNQNTNAMGGMQGGNMMGGAHAGNMMGGAQAGNMMGGMQGNNMMGGMQSGMMGGMQGNNMMGGMQGNNMMGSMPQQSGMMGGSTMGGMQGANAMAGGMGGMQSGGMMGMQTGANMTGAMPNMQSGGMGQTMNQASMSSTMGNDAGWHGFTS